MISSVKGSLIRGAYQDNSLKSKEQEKSVQSISKQGDTSRIEVLKASIERGEYRVDIETLAKRIAQELI
ncbi:flagellar biosynthesis anti-sigma factor FlgM [Sulfuricurvum sp.]|uniref:flagellar biosynthesis anti-sigma factor FlgM n=1 Tax=Sulfuricurvum sp. TaxID=2025608 RepID=UPI00198BD60A|nr:flagellar biosynthesis anti-sigma factor FlgM [Sulfuricurvum sp.]MBD3798901.1 flagellar biosynthesis anti-sigma factor FlgM [Campylobacterota bacterium]MBD3805745.1 flagellar biosynthesis anti-sigma factor FlgM [Sulfuricurvum sp.]